MSDSKIIDYNKNNGGYSFNITASLPVPTATTKTPISSDNAEKKSNNWVYSDKWIVMQNKLIYSISDLSLDERRLILFLSPIVRKAIDKNPEQEFFTIHIKDYVKEYQLSHKGMYKKLREYADSLQAKSFSLWLFDENEQESYENRISWSTRTRYKPRKGCIDIKLDEIVIKMLTVFDRQNPYTKFDKSLIVDLSAHALILLELLSSFVGQRNQQKLFTLKYLRTKFNCLDRYKRNAEFIRTVLVKSANALESKIDYVIEFDTQANEGGRCISHVLVKIKSKPNLITVSNAKNSQSYKEEDGRKVRTKPLTDKQIAKIGANKKVFIDENCSLLSDAEQKRSYDDIFADFEVALKDPNRVKAFKYIDEFLRIQKGQDIKELLKLIKINKDN